MMSVEMKRQRLLVLAVPLLAFVGGLGWWSLPPSVPVVSIVRGTSISAVYASGAVEPTERVDVSARVTGPITELRVREGDVVKEGDLLVRIDAPTLGFDVSRAAADDSAAAMRFGTGTALESVRAQRAALNAQLAQAKAEHARAEGLSRSGALSPAELDASGARVDVLTAQIAANAAQERDLTIGLKADAQRQRAVFDSARTKLNEAEVRAPLSGTILSRRVERGQVVAANTVLVRIGDLSRLHLEVDVDEADVAQVRTGQAAAIRLYAMRGKVLSGKVAKIHPEGDRDRKAFRVEIDVDEKVEGLYPGMTAEVNIVLAQHDGVLLAPLASIHGDRIWVVEDGRAYARAVSVLQRDLSLAEVLGLPEGAEVIVGDPAKLRDGMRVRAIAAPATSPSHSAPAKSGALSAASPR